jgi:glucosamine-6-phosphate deaminase
MLSSVRTLELAGASVIVYRDAPTACQAAAERIAETIRAASAARGRAVLGLATGATPEPVYARLVAMHKDGQLSFANVVTYNLDEYYPISPIDPRSYRVYMHEHLFAHVDIAANRAHMLDGTVPESAVAQYAADYDRWIVNDGGLDLQLLGVGRNGHIGFNEPSDCRIPDALKSPTRLVDLHHVTRASAAREFGDEARVIPRALTLGVASILAARSILVLAFGAHKAEPVAQSLQGAMTARMPGSFLQSVPGKVTWLLDAEAAQGL